MEADTTGYSDVLHSRVRSYARPVPYYREFQSGLYMFNGLAYGYLLEAFSAPSVCLYALSLTAHIVIPDETLGPKTAKSSSHTGAFP